MRRGRTVPTVAAAVVAAVVVAAPLTGCGRPAGSADRAQRIERAVQDAERAVAELEADLSQDAG